jgi:hypothetical protein
MRMIGDLIDLGFGGDDGPWLADRALAWIRDDVNREEVEAVRRLCARLALGDGSMFESRDSSRDEIRLLRHIVAGAEDESYRRSLKLRALFVGPRPARGLRGRLHTIRRAVFVGPAQVDLIYGRPRSRLAYAWRRLARPFDLMLRSLRAVWHGLEVRLRR